jgi:hypothetical protein
MSNAPMKYLDTPEEYIKIPDGEKFPIDAINCAKTRAQAILTMLINDIGNENLLSPTTVSNGLWAIEGYLDQIEILIDHSYKTTHEARNESKLN